MRGAGGGHGQPRERRLESRPETERLVRHRLVLAALGVLTEAPLDVHVIFASGEADRCRSQRSGASALRCVLGKGGPPGCVAMLVRRVAEKTGTRS